MSKPKLAVRSATKIYGSGENALTALENINLDIEDGEFVSLVGPSGCGKTTLLWSMSGLHACLSGQALHGVHPASRKVCGGADAPRQPQCGRQTLMSGSG